MRSAFLFSRFQKESRIDPVRNDKLRAIETGHSGFDDDAFEVNPGFLNHRPERTGAGVALPDGEGEQVQVTGAVKALGEVVLRGGRNRCGHGEYYPCATLSVCGASVLA